MEMDIILTSGGYRARTSNLGAGLRELDFNRSPLIWSYQHSGEKRGGQGDVLIPFPGRIAGGEYRFEGRSHRLNQNDKDGPNAIHGFLRSLEWEVVEQAKDRVRFRRAVRPDEFAGYPFSLEVGLSYEVGPSGLTSRFEVRNTGQDAAPFGAGFHPYLVSGEGRIDDWLVKIPAREVIELKQDLLPSGRVVAVEGSPVDFRSVRAIGAGSFNHCLTGLACDPDGIARAELSDASGSKRVRIWMDKAFPYVVIYSGDAIQDGFARKSFAIEPMTCATDAFNRPDWGLRVLQPGESFSGAWGLERG